MLKKIAVIDIGSNSIRMVIHGMNGKRGLRNYIMSKKWPG